ncbi:MAG: SDR family oxidoreductase [Magnetococcales bacterium]|nr:SDR family oxidoreductase [Magnetococcales bacterium]
MRILICGASGFVGATIAERLSRAGHTVVRGVRRPERAGDRAIDYAQDTDVATWLPRLAGIDVVINAVGILIERGRQRFEAIHQQAPCALFAACQQAGVQRVVQISALGADRGDTTYFQSKRATDAFLMTLPIAWQVVRPSLIYGPTGASARMFRMLASLPLVFLPAGGEQLLQPIHVDDLSAVVLKLIDPTTPAGQCLDLVGPTPITYAAMLRTYRSALGFAAAWSIPVPGPLVSLAAATVGRIPGVMLTPDTWKMLRDGSTGDATATERLLGQAPRPLAAFISDAERPLLRQEALAAWRPLLFRGVHALIWILSGLVAAFVYPLAQTLDLLARVGLAGLPALIVLYGASAFDVILGILTLTLPSRRLWLLQIGVILFYTAIIVVALPEYLIHPFGPITKNLALLALLFDLLAEEERP